MNREKKEALKRYREARVGLSKEQIEALDRKEALDAEIEKLARSIHEKRFPEEYDMQYDSIADARDRSCGENPMSAEYVARVTAKRKVEGVSPLSEAGLATSRDTWNLAVGEATRIMHEREEGRTG